MGHYDIYVFDRVLAFDAANLRAEFEALLRLSNIVVPILSSAWDIQAGEHFITQLMTQRLARSTQTITVVGNRISGNLAGHQNRGIF